jgi:hypothetical protein
LSYGDRIIFLLFGFKRGQNPDTVEGAKM